MIVQRESSWELKGSLKCTLILFDTDNHIWRQLDVVNMENAGAQAMRLVILPRGPLS